MNPLKLDPTRTTLLRKQFGGTIASRFKRVKGLVNKRIASGGEVTEDWLRTQLELEVLSVDTDPFVAKGYNAGRRNAYRTTKKRARIFLSGEGKAIAEKSFFQDNPPTQLLGDLQQRTRNELNGIVDTVMQQSARAMSNSKLAGETEKQMASRIKDRIDRIGVTRSRTLAESETIRSHAEGGLDTMEALGVQVISVNVEWTTRGDARVCPLCRPLQGKVMTIKMARGMFPRHPRCRCSPTPTSTQKVNKKQLRSAVSKSKKAGQPKKKTKLKKKNTWLPGIK